MRNLYWKIFLSFWLASTLIIITIAWLTSELTQQSSLSTRERIFMDSYANAAVATYENGGNNALNRWLTSTDLSKQMQLYLLTNQGEINSQGSPPPAVKAISQSFVKNQLNAGIYKSGNLIVSHEILSPKGIAYRLVAMSDKPLSLLVQIPWTALAIRLLVTIFISGLICYFLSRYLTQPLRSLQLAARSLAKGNFKTRVGPLSGHSQDEIARLSSEFDSMAEKIETLVLSKERLLQDISHELRTPLARLHIALELGRKKTENRAESEFDRMELEISRLNELIGEILEFARLEKSTNHAKKEPIELSQIIEDLVADANYENPAEPPRVKITTLQQCPLHADQRLIRRAIENILRNAIRYSPDQESVEVALSCDMEKHVINIDLRDKGPGVPEDQLEKIFTPFYRVDTSREKKTGGYGLGLAIADQAIRLHNGVIYAKNQKEGGLWVRIALPF